MSQIKYQTTSHMKTENVKKKKDKKKTFNSFNLNVTLLLTITSSNIISMVWTY